MTLKKIYFIITLKSVLINSSNLWYFFQNDLLVMDCEYQTSEKQTITQVSHQQKLNLLSCTYQLIVKSGSFILILIMVKIRNGWPKNVMKDATNLAQIFHLTP